MQQDAAIVVGGGLAGLACAVALADDGLRVVVLERSHELGGRARSWTHAPTGDGVDIGPHVVHNEYANFLAFLERLGTRHLVTWQPKKLITLASRPPTVLRHRPLPPPLGLLPDLARAPGLTFRDLWSNNGPTWRALKFGEEDVPELDAIPACDYLRGEGVSQAMIDWFWRFAAMVVMNVPLEECSTAALLRVHAQLIGRRGLHFGFAAVGLSELYVAQSERAIRAAGGEVVRNARAVAVVQREHNQVVRLDDGREVAARFCVCAVPPAEMEALLPGVAETSAFEPSPYISTYLWLDRRIADERFWAHLWKPGRLNYDFYDLSLIRAGWERRPSVLAANLIYSHRARGMDDTAIAQATLREAAEFAPAAAQARIVHADVHRIPMAIACPKPGTEAKRPRARTRIAGLFLAGDWTQTRLPSSMESAVRSGFLAAEAVLADLGRARCLAFAPRPTDGLAGLVRRITRAYRSTFRGAGPVLASRLSDIEESSMHALLTKVSPSITDMIRADHSRVLATFHRYKAGTSPATKQALASAICLALEVHAQVEEEIFYPAMSSVDAALVGKLIPEHDKMRTLIGALRGMDAASPEYDATVMELMRKVIHHVADEETVLLAEAERVGELGARFMKRRLQLMAPHAGEVTRAKARAFPKGNLLVLAGLLVGAWLLFQRLRRT